MDFITYQKKKKVWILDCCYVCKGNRESIDHLLLNCPIATELWTMVFVLFGIQGVMLKALVDLLMCWQGKFGHRL